jgi:hypothetical protein
MAKFVWLTQPHLKQLTLLRFDPVVPLIIPAPSIHSPFLPWTFSVAFEE